MLDIKIVEPEVHSIPANEVSVNDWIVKDFDMPLMYFDFLNINNKDELHVKQRIIRKTN